MGQMKFFSDNAHWGTAILRTFFGVAFIIAGLDKVLSMPMAKEMFTGMFGGAGPALLYLAIAIELLGGLALLFNWHTACAAMVLSVFILVAMFKTFKLGQAGHMVGTLREMLVMNTGGGNTAVNFAYLAGLLSLAFSSCVQCKKK
jgi:uncharacterized membrane protein YphA (DoxX/SURF4 family)